MIYLMFKEKWDDRIVGGETKEDIARFILNERINQTYDNGLSYWYGDDTENAKKALADGKAFEYISGRMLYEYESFCTASIEIV